MTRLLPVAVAMAAVLAARPAAAQPAGSIPFGRGVTYGEIAREYAGLRLRPRAASDSTVRSGDPSLGIQGLVVDETATPSGRTFYEAFYLVWTPPAAAARSTLAVSEQPLPGNSTAVLIRVDGELAFQARLPRRADEIAELAAQAAQFVAARLSGG